MPVLSFTLSFDGHERGRKSGPHNEVKANFLEAQHTETCMEQKLFAHSHRAHQRVNREQSY